MFYKESETEEPVVFVVFRNSDFNEGRGPDMMDSIWITQEEASKYIDQQPGIQGRRAKWSQETHGDWYIKIMPLIKDCDSKFKIDNEALKQKALAKLTPQERKVLGL